MRGPIDHGGERARTKGKGRFFLYMANQSETLLQDINELHMSTATLPNHVGELVTGQLSLQRGKSHARAGLGQFFSAGPPAPVVSFAPPERAKATRVQFVTEQEKTPICCLGNGLVSFVCTYYFASAARYWSNTPRIMSLLGTPS